MNYEFGIRNLELGRGIRNYELEMANRRKGGSCNLLFLILICLFRGICFQFVIRNFSFVIQYRL